ncbi:MAG: hypothetical protein P1U36_09885 [Legionellaceae bacterium]|nr:hypothetical protein [Legionellaceae bacterium]
MFFTNNLVSVRSVLVGLIFSLLFGCATTYQGDGEVIDKQPFSIAHTKTTAPIKERTVQGGLIGVASGATVGGTIGLLGAVLAPSASAATWTLAFASAGGLISGGVGLLLGGGLGLAQYGLTPSEMDVWQYKVKASNSSELWVIRQKAPPIPLDSHVKVMKKNGTLLIKPISN